MKSASPLCKTIEDASWVFDRNRLVEGCRWIGFSGEVTGAFTAAAEKLGADSAWKEKLERSRENLLTAVRAPDSEENEPMFPALVYLSALPSIQAMHRERGIPEEVTKETVRDMEIWLRHYHSLHGRWGFNELRWPARYFTGKVYGLGRLQFEIAAFPASCTADGISLVPGNPVLSVHIPAAGKLDDDECGASIRKALEFFPRYFPEHAFKGIICISWMMNRQLEKALPAESNLVRFVRRFQPMAVENMDDKQVWERVFGGPVPDLALAPRDTALRLAVITHAEAGEKWLTAGGYILRNTLEVL